MRPPRIQRTSTARYSIRRQSGWSLARCICDAFTLIHRQAIVEMAARFRLPAVYPSPGFAKIGGLCSYGFDQNQQFREAASYVSRLLSGTKPPDLPVQTPTKFELLLNLKAARALDLLISPSLLAAADGVIE